MHTVVASKKRVLMLCKWAGGRARAIGRYDDMAIVSVIGLRAIGSRSIGQ